MNRDVRSLFRQFQRDATPNAAGATRDQRILSLERHNAPPVPAAQHVSAVAGNGQQLGWSPIFFALWEKASTKSQRQSVGPYRVAGEESLIQVVVRPRFSPGRLLPQATARPAGRDSAYGARRLTNGSVFLRLDRKLRCVLQQSAQATWLGQGPEPHSRRAVSIWKKHCQTTDL